jgi:Zn-dependent protease
MQGYQNYKQYKIGNYTTSNIELRDLLKAWIVISLAFAIMLAGINFFSAVFLIFFAVSAVAVGSGFLFHELAHKLVAQRYGCFAEFRADNMMLILALVMAALLRAVFAAPGAVVIGGGHVDFKRNGKISIAGPLTNFVLAVMFMTGNIFIPNMIFSYGFLINAWLGLFNMIPFGFFDGAKIWKWNIPVWIGAVAAGVLLLMVRFLLMPVT